MREVLEVDASVRLLRPIENDDVENDHKVDVNEWCLCMILMILRIEWVQRTN